MKKPEILIRKYSDGRLCDTGASHYLQLQDIARMVRDGSDVGVVDGRTGKDVTRIILTQTITETAKESQIGLPLQLSTHIVRASDTALNSSLNLYYKAQNSFYIRLSEAKNAVPAPVRLHAQLAGRPTRGHRQRRGAKSNNSAAALRKCSRA